jgi:hypothetical protein
MQLARLNVQTPARRALSGIASVPMMAALALISIVITLVVVAEASRPARSERVRRRIVHPPASPDEAAGEDVSMWRRAGDSCASDDERRAPRFRPSRGSPPVAYPAAS